jgi:putative transposase
VNRENIFFEERNYEYFLNLYWKHIEPVVDTFAYCLLRNHFHLAIRVKSEEEILETREKTLRVSSANSQTLKRGSSANQDQGQPRKPPVPVRGLGSHFVSTQFTNFFNAYAKAINKAYQRTGSLFQHPFGRVPITSDRQFWRVIAYVHQNPQKHKFVEDFRDWKYSSYGILLADTPTSLQRDVVLDWFGGKDEYLNLHADWVSDARSKWFAEDDFD